MADKPVDEEQADDKGADELITLLERVTDRRSFFAFVRALIADREDEIARERVQPSNPWGPGANGWENGTIEAYLDGALTWAEDSDPAVEPSWHGFAEFLYAGKIYE